MAQYGDNWAIAYAAGRYITVNIGREHQILIESITTPSATFLDALKYYFAKILSAHSKTYRIFVD